MRGLGFDAADLWRFTSIGKGNVADSVEEATTTPECSISLDGAIFSDYNSELRNDAAV